MDGRMVALLFGLMSFAFIGVMAWLAARSKPHEARLKRLEVLDKALAHPELDAATRSEILRVLADEQRRQNAHWLQRLAPYAPIGRALWFGAGWLMFVFGGFGTIVRALDLMPSPALQDMVPLAVAGFAMLTMPMALGELQARRHRATTADR